MAYHRLSVAGTIGLNLESVLHGHGCCLDADGNISIPFTIMTRHLNPIVAIYITWWLANARIKYSLSRVTFAHISNSETTRDTPTQCINYHDFIGPFCSNCCRPRNYAFINHCVIIIIF